MINKNSIIIAFDFGMRSIGIAIGQCITCTASPLTSFKANVGVPNWKQIENLLNEWQSKTVIVGLPINMDGSEQPITFKAREFANQLIDKFSVQVILHDERLSTVEAKWDLFQHTGLNTLEKNKIDAKSAVIILESWLTQFIK